MLEKIYSELIDWAKSKWKRAILLVKFVIFNNWELSEEQRDNIIECMLDEEWIQNSINKFDDEVTLNKYDSNKNILLKKIDEIKWVNWLIEWQTLEFWQNLTVIYWINWTGKTWYSRILRSLWNSFDENQTILWNVFLEKKEDQYCKISYLENWKEKIWEWKWNWTLELPLWLFNNNCVNLWLKDKRSLVFTPNWFNLFEILKNEINILNTKITKKIENISWMIDENLIIKSKVKWIEVKNFIDSLSLDSNEVDIDNFETKTVKQLNKKKNDLINEKNKSNTDFLKLKIQNIDSILWKLLNLKGILDKYKQLFNKDNWQKYIKNKSDLEHLKKMPKKTINDIWKEKWIEFYDSCEFSNFIKMADRYIKLISNSKLDKCPYCNQELTDEATKLIELYEEAINNEAQKEIDEINDQINIFEEKILWLPDFNDTAELDWITQQNSKYIQNAKKDYKNHIKESNYLEMLNIDKITKLINKKISEQQSDKTKSEESLKNIENIFNKLESSIMEIEDRILFISEKEKIKNALWLIKSKDKFKTLCSKISANTLSKKASKIQNELFKEKYNEIFTNERKKLMCPDYIEYDLRIVNSSPSLTQNIWEKNLLSILSEGEQKSIALAEFITELNISWNNNPVVLDDPVNSLDEQRIDIVTRRLIDLSEERQVIIFTHNIIFFYNIEQVYEEYYLWKNKDKKDYEYIHYVVSKKNWHPWLLSKNKSPAQNTYNAYMDKIKKEIIENKNWDLSDEELYSKWYEYLRSAIELLIEEKIFSKTVRRYKKNVATWNFININWKLIDEHKKTIIEIFSRASSFNPWHSSANEYAIRPEKQIFQKDFERIQNIYKLFK